VRGGSLLLAAERPFAAALLAASLGEAGFEVEWTASLDRASGIAAGGDYDAVVVDLGGRKAPSLELVEDLLAALRRTPVVLIAPSERVRPDEISAFVVAKPFGGDELVATVQAAIVAGQRPAADILAFHARCGQQAANVIAGPDREVSR
jgi:DNA-binding response OmpR family regulator